MCNVLKETSSLAFLLWGNGRTLSDYLALLCSWPFKILGAAIAIFSYMLLWILNTTIKAIITTTFGLYAKSSNWATEALIWPTIYLGLILRSGLIEAQPFEKSISCFSTWINELRTNSAQLTPYVWEFLDGYMIWLDSELVPHYSAPTTLINYLSTIEQVRFPLVSNSGINIK